MIIPCNTTNDHYFIICVYFRGRRIRVFDSLPNHLDDKGRRPFVELIQSYVKEEHRLSRGYDLDESKWNWDPTVKGTCPKQKANSNDCGVYSCYFMELLMNKVKLEVLNAHSKDLSQNGRSMLWNAIGLKKPALPFKFKRI